MSEQNTKMMDDPWLIKAFKDYEKMPKADKATMDWTLTSDYQVFSEFLVRDLKDIRAKLKNADDQYLLYVCQHIFNLIDWMTLIENDAGMLTFVKTFENLFEKEFGDRHLLKNIYDDCLAKWLADHQGPQKIGFNFYTNLEGNLYYRNWRKEWSAVDKATAFDLKPRRKPVDDRGLIERLNSDYQETWYDKIIRQWTDKQYTGKLPDDFLKYEVDETSPEDYFEFTREHVKTLLQNPISIEELERWNGTPITDLEDIVKIGAGMLDMVNKRRADDAHTLYLLRDCLAFYEMHRAIDFLNSEDSSADQIMVGRKLLSLKTKEWGYYILTLTSLYEAHRHFPTNFQDFYNDYTRLLTMFESVNPDFAAIIGGLAEYIKQHIKTAKKKIVVFDIGFQGSIALLVKYIIDHHIQPAGPNGKISTDIKVGICAMWSKELFGPGRYDDDYFPFLNRVQLLARNNDLYHYKPDSLSAGALRVQMGDKENQRRAAVELAVFMMVTRLARNK